jgi:DNA-binding response OmpR family regulator
MARILVVDDSPSVLALVRTLLEREGHFVLQARDGAEGLRRLYADAPDLLVLDLEMPRLDGFAALDRIRRLTSVPVLVCSGRPAEEQLQALRAGADDMIGKPFDGRELVARVEALLRRSGADSPEHIDGDGWATVDRARHEAVVDGRRLDVTPLELRLLGAFLRHSGIALSHEQLLDLVWEDGGGSREQVKAAVLSLRRKLGEGSSAIETVRGIGYRWRTPVSDGRPPSARQGMSTGTAVRTNHRS